MITINVDEVLAEADWPKRTDDRLETLKVRYPKGGESKSTVPPPIKENIKDTP